MKLRHSILAVLILSSAALAESPAAETKEKYWAVSSDSLFMPLEDKATKISAETAAKLFDDKGDLKEGWEKAFPGGVKDPLNGAAAPGHKLVTSAGVVRYSEKHLVIRVSRGSISTMTDNDHRDLGDLLVERSKEIDEKFELKDLQKIVEAEYHGIRQGVKWEVAEKESGDQWTEQFGHQSASFRIFRDQSKKVTVEVRGEHVMQVRLEK